MRASLIALLALALPALTACGDGPEKVHREPPEATGSSGAYIPPEDVVSEVTLFGTGSRGGPATPAPATAGAPVEAELIASGVVTLSGELADVGGGALFAIGRDAATGQMGPVGKYELARDGRRNAAGLWELPFNLTTANLMMGGGLVPAKLDLELRYDPDGKVDSTQGQASITIPVDRGATGITATIQELTTPAAQPK